MKNIDSQLRAFDQHICHAQRVTGSEQLLHLDSASSLLAWFVTTLGSSCADYHHSKAQEYIQALHSGITPPVVSPELFEFWAMRRLKQGVRSCLPSDHPYVRSFA